MTEAVRRLRRIAQLVEKAQSRWPAGTAGSKGGQFAPGHQGGGSGHVAHHVPAKKEPAPPPAGWKPHPQPNDKGEQVAIHYPTKASHPSTWTDARSVATFTPGGNAPEKLHGTPMRPWRAPTSLHEWERVDGQKPEIDRAHPFEPVEGKNVGAGVIIREPDGRLWLTRPTNSFGGYHHTFPKGTVEKGLNLQASAIKEAYEETGLKVRIVGLVGDYERTTSKARYYLAERVGGTPKDMGWESQALRLAPPHRLGQLLNMAIDKTIASDFHGEMMLKSRRAARTAPLYVYRTLLNGAEFIAWAKGVGFLTTLPEDDLHVTVVYSREPMRWGAVEADEGTVTVEGGARSVQSFGGVAVLEFESDEIEGRWQAFIAAGASWDFPSYRPHVTITWSPPDGLAVDMLKPFEGPLVFGPERFAPIKDGWADKLVEKAKGGRGHYNAKQARWPAGTALGGQWMAVGAGGIVAPPIIAGGHAGKNSAYQKKAEALHQAAQAGQMGAVLIAYSKLKEKNDADAAAGKKSSHVKWNQQLQQYAEKLLTDHAAGPKAEASATAIRGPMKLSDLVKTGGKPGGSNPGAMYADGKAGGDWLVKGNLQLAQKKVTQAVSDDRAKNEVLASKLMHAVAPGSAPEMRLVDLQGEHGGGLGVASKMVHGAEAFNPKNGHHLQAIRKDYALHAWLGNYDVLGMGYDNTVIKDGKAVNIDPGGAILFRAQGLTKFAFDKDAPEWETMRTTTAEQKAVFGPMTASRLRASAEELAKIDDATIRKLVQAHGPSHVMQQQDLADTLIARRDAILAKAGVTAKPAPGPLAVPAAVEPPKVPRIKDTAKAPANTGTHHVKPTFSTGLPSDGYYAGLADKAEKLHAEGALFDLKAMATKSGKKNAGQPAWPSTTANGAKIEVYHKLLVADLEAKQTAQLQQIAQGNGTITAGGQSFTVKDGVLNPSGGKVSPRKVAELAEKHFGMAMQPLIDASLSGKPSSLFSGQMIHAALTGNAQAFEEMKPHLSAGHAAFAKDLVAAMGHGGAPVHASPEPKAAAALPNFEAAKLPAGNSNAGSHNPKVEKISAYAKAGDVKGILALNYGTNTYGKKQAQLANDALAAMGSPHQVTPGQKSNAHPALAAGSAQEMMKPPPAPKSTAAAPKATPKPVYKIPEPPDFQNWKGPGAGLSSKASVNAQNQQLAGEIKALGEKQDVPALKAMTFHALDAQGAPTGVEKPIAEHPSQHIKAYHADVVHAATNPYVPPVIMTERELSKVPDLIKNVLAKVGDVKALASAATKIGRYALLGKVDGKPFDGFPPAVATVKNGKLPVADLYTASKANYAKLSKTEQQAIKDYTGGGYASQNNAHTGVGSTAASHTIAGIEKAAVTLPPGTVLSRKFTFASDHGKNIQALIAAQGSVIKDFGIISTSTNPSTWSGDVHLKIYTAPGAKGLYVANNPKGGGGAISNHPGENEIILPHGTKFYVKSVKTGSAAKHTDEAGHWGQHSSTVVELVALPHIS